MGKFGKDKRDVYYRMAKVEGFRARSAYKLLQIDEHFGVMSGVKRVVDLCAAPGSWTQVLARKLVRDCDTSAVNSINGIDCDNEVKIIAVDLQAMAAIPGVIQLQGDITNEKAAEEIVSLMSDAKADLVVCDGAPDVTGLHDIDDYIQGELLLAALFITTSVLKTGGTFVAKIFRGKEVSLLFSQLKVFFGEVIITKPRSSRNSSIESFAVCRHYCPPLHYKPVMFNTYLNQKCDQYFDAVDSGVNKHIIPFIACGDLNAFDSDSTYLLNVTNSCPLKYEYRSPTQSPIDPPYQKAVQLKKSSNLAKPFLNIHDNQDIH